MTTLTLWTDRTGEKAYVLRMHVHDVHTETLLVYVDIQIHFKALKVG